MRGDEQEPDERCGTLGTSGHVTAKSSICKRGVLYKSGVYALKVTCLTLGGLYGVRGEGMVEILWHRRETREHKVRPNAPHWTEVPATASDRHAEVSRGPGEKQGKRGQHYYLKENKIKRCGGC